ncbi:zeta toxin family protein [Eubacterium sp. MSJ-33]|nr:zeta toxin family protein [Eubacterium sp. MSJ-33]
MLNKKPMVLVFAGPNGSGKSTITKYIPIIGKYSNADDVVASTQMDNLTAAEYVDKLRYEMIELKQDFTFETVLSSERKIKIIKEAKKSGYFVKCIFVLTSDPMINVMRVSMRVGNGGHSVPEEKIISRYYKSLDNLKKLFTLCDILHVYDNSAGYERVIRKHKDDLQIFSNKYWSDVALMSLLGLSDVSQDGYLTDDMNLFEKTDNN